MKELGAEPLYIEELPEARHIFSHIEWRMKAYRIRVSSLEQTHAPGILFADKKESERNYAIPSAFGAYENICNGSAGVFENITQRKKGKYIARCVILKYRIVTLHEEENK